MGPPSPKKWTSTKFVVFSKRFKKKTKRKIETNVRFFQVEFEFLVGIRPACRWSWRRRIAHGRHLLFVEGFLFLYFFFWVVGPLLNFSRLDTNKIQIGGASSERIFLFCFQKNDDGRFLFLFKLVQSCCYSLWNGSPAGRFYRLHPADHPIDPSAFSLLLLIIKSNNKTQNFNKVGNNKTLKNDQSIKFPFNIWKTFWGKNKKSP